MARIDESRPFLPVNIAVLTVSDTRTEADDKSGRTLAELITRDGQRYLDYSSGIGVTNTGHAHPRVAAAIAAQAQKLIHGQQNIVYHEPGLRLYERLPGLLPGGPYQAFLSNSGAEAVEASVKLARVATGRPVILAFRYGYHGRTAIHELLDLTERIREMILDKRPASEIKRAATEEGMTFLRESAVQKVREGVTTLKEINKVTFIEG